VHGDVLRPPAMPLLLSASVGVEESNSE